METTVGQRIMQVRMTSGMNQKEFSNKIGITQAALSRIESDATAPKSKTLHSIATNFDVNVQFLLTGSGNIKNEETASTENISWKEEAYSALKSERDLLKNELNRVWAIVQHLTNGSKPDFLKAIKEAGLLKYSLPGAQKRGSLIASA